MLHQVKKKISNKFQKIGLITILFLSCFIVKNVFAEITFSNIEFSNFKDRMATITWNTNQETKGDIYYGETEDNLNRYMGYSLYRNSHESVLSGLDEDKTYYYKIKATNSLGETSETFVHSFSTNDMVDTTRPIILSQDIIQVTGDAVVVKWVTDKDTKAVINYGFEEVRNKKTGDGSFKKEHTLTISNLINNSRYSLQIIVEDKSKNKAESRVLFFNTRDKTTDHNLVISKVKPQGPGDQAIGLREATISWETNWVAKGLVSYGLKSNSLNKKIYVSPSKATEHVARITGLEPNTKYYFKIRSYESLYNKSKETIVLSFTTKSISVRLKTGSLVKGLDSKIYIINGNNKYWIQNEKVFNELGFKWFWIENISDSVLDEYKTIGNLSDSKKHPDGMLIRYDGKPNVYIMESGRKRPIPSAKIFNKNGYDWNKIIVISKANAKKYSYSTGKTIQ